MAIQEMKEIIEQEFKNHVPPQLSAARKLIEAGGYTEVDIKELSTKIPDEQYIPVINCLRNISLGLTK